jgi:hypothetical protein
MKRKYRVFFEIGGKKMQVTVIANNESDAQMKVISKMIFHKIHFEGMAKADDDFLDSIKDIFNL